MKEDEPTSRPLRTPRAAAIAGVVFTLLLTATLALIRLATPSDADEVGAWLNDPSRKRMIVLALNLVPSRVSRFCGSSESSATGSASARTDFRHGVSG